MSGRTTAAILYGVGSILLVGILLGALIAGAWDIAGYFGLALFLWQLAFFFFATGYTNGRDDQKKGLVK